jgi:hypothetical protein
MAVGRFTVARQRKGVALSQQLLRELRFHADFACPPHHSEIAVDARRATQQAPMVSGSADHAPESLTSCPQHAPPPKFRIYSSFGATVPATSPLQAQRLLDIRRCRMRPTESQTTD